MRTSQLYAPPMAMVTTLGLLLLMYSLINTTFEMPTTKAPTVIDSVVMPERVIEVLFPDAPVRPDPPAKAPPPVAEPVARTEVAGATDLSFGMPASEGPTTNPLHSSSSDFMPIIKVAPQYPRSALSRGIEGYVTVSFTVTETGRTRNVVVLEATTKDGSATSIFDRAAIAAAEQFKYQPRSRDGVAVELHGVKNRFVFELD